MACVLIYSHVGTLLRDFAGEVFMATLGAVGPVLIPNGGGNHTMVIPMFSQPGSQEA